MVRPASDNLGFVRTTFALALRNLWRQPRRSALGVAAVTCGIVALMLANGFIEWIFLQIRESTIRGHLGHLQVVRPGYHDTGKSDPFAYLLPAAGPALDTLTNEPGVTTVAPRLAFSGLASLGESTVSFVGEGVIPSREAELSRSLVIAAGTNLRDADTQGVLLGIGLAHNLGTKVGDRVVLIVTKASGGIDAVELTVQGLFFTEIKAYDDSALRLSIETARQLLHATGAHSWLVLLDDTSHTDAVIATLRTQLPPRDFQVVPWYEMADFYNKTVALFSKQVQVMRIIIAAIILLSIVNTMMMSVMERTGEIGTSMALGVKRRAGYSVVRCRRGASGHRRRHFRTGAWFRVGSAHLEDRHPHAGATRHGARICRPDPCHAVDGRRGLRACRRGDTRGERLSSLEGIENGHCRRASGSLGSENPARSGWEAPNNGSESEWLIHPETQATAKRHPMPPSFAAPGDAAC